MLAPTEAQVRELVRQLRNTNWADIEAKLIDAIHRNLTVAEYADGYSSNTLGSRANSDLTSVESAASRRIFGRDDAHHGHLVRASTALTHAVADINTVVQNIRDLVELSTNKIVDANECAICKTADIHTEWEHYGDVNGTLPTKVHMCAPCLKFISKHKRQPTYQELRAHADTGYWGRVG